MLELIKKHVNIGISFAFETTLSGLGYARMIPQWRALGYRVDLYFLALPTAEYAIERVALRVKHGGHFIPDDVVRRRFAAGLRNFNQVYKPLVDDWTHVDNAVEPKKIIDWSER